MKRLPDSIKFLGRMANYADFVLLSVVLLKRNYYLYAFKNIIHNTNTTSGYISLLFGGYEFELNSSSHLFVKLYLRNINTKVPT